MKIAANVLGWILALFLAVVFLFAGGVKLIGSPAMIHEFDQIGIGQWFRYFTGIWEVLGAIGILIPKYRFWAALELAIVMLGATFTNIVILHVPPLARLTSLLLALALVLAWLRRSRRASKTLNKPAASAA
jgi:uncharacterized membrane protein YphA (DoxX/SURF4 family)